MHRAGYGLKGIYSLDQHYAQDLASYYKALAVGPSHNYYLGRAEADITGFVGFFCAGPGKASSNSPTRPGDRDPTAHAALRPARPQTMTRPEFAAPSRRA